MMYFFSRHTVLLGILGALVTLGQLATALPRDPPWPPAVPMPKSIKDSEAACDWIYRSYTDEYMEAWRKAAAQRPGNRRGPIPQAKTAESKFAIWVNPAEKVFGFDCADTRDTRYSGEAVINGRFIIACDREKEVVVFYNAIPIRKRRASEKVRRARCVPKEEIRKEAEVKAGMSDCEDVHVMQPGEAEIYAIMDEDVPQRPSKLLRPGYSSFPSSDKPATGTVLTLSELNGDVLGTDRITGHLFVPDLKGDRHYRACVQVPPGQGNVFYAFALSST